MRRSRRNNRRNRRRFGRKRTYKRYNKKPSIGKVKKMVKSQIRKLGNYTSYSYYGEGACSSPYVIFEPTTLNAYTKMWLTSSHAETARAAKINISAQWKIWPKTEKDIINYTVFWVKPTQMSRDVDPGIAPVANTILTAGKDYFVGGDYSAVRMNPERWNVLKSYRFATGSNTDFSGGYQQIPIQSKQMFRGKETCAMTIKNYVRDTAVQNQAQDSTSWRNVTYPDWTQRHFLIVFNDNSVADLESPALTITCVMRAFTQST